MTVPSRHRQYKDHGPLGALLVKACPPDEAGIKSIPTLARYIRLAPQSLYKWISQVKIPPDRVVEIVSLNKRAVADGRMAESDAVSIEDFSPYVFK